MESMVMENCAVVKVPSDLRDARVKHEAGEGCSSSSGLVFASCPSLTVSGLSGTQTLQPCPLQPLQCGAGAAGGPGYPSLFSLHLEGQL